MTEKDSIWMLFDSVIDDENEKKILKLIFENKTNEEIIKEFLRFEE